ncbi:MAG TPA: hypothetical protein VGK37_11155 [Casimicrobiaceae bacterium]
MRPRGRYVSATLLALTALIATGAAAMTQTAGSEESGDSVRFPPATVVYPGTREFRWTVRVPVVTIEQREFVFRAPTGFTRPQRWDYEGPAVRTERRIIATYPEFSCKYVDWSVSNECLTVWRNVYADLPVIVARPQHLVFDMPDWRWKTQLFPINVPRWAWKEEHWRVSVPVIVSEPPEATRHWDQAASRDEYLRVRSALTARQAAALAQLDAGLRALDSGIAEVEAHAGDPRRVEADDGSTLDLLAARATLGDDRAQVAERFGRIEKELDAAAAAGQ